MDLIEFFEQQVAKWQEEQRCGRCWEFSATLWEDASNIFQTNEECCTIVLFTGWRETINPIFAQNDFPIKEYTDYIFTLDIVERGDLGTNNYNEIDGHPISESRIKTVYSPLRNCINTNKLTFDFCEFIGLKVDEMRWEITPTRAYLDNNYYGWNVKATFRIQNTDIL